MRVLVTGGAGYIGSVVIEELLAAGADRVVVLDDLSEGHAAAVASPAILERGPCADAALVERLCRRERIQAAVHMAASSRIGDSLRDPAAYYRNNVLDGLRLLDGLRAAQVGCFVFSSTAAVYGDPRVVPIDEGAPIASLNPYADTKLAFERVLAWFDQAYGSRSVCLRYFNAAGATARNGEDHDPETHLIPIVLDVARGRRPCVEIFGDDYPTADGTCVRDYIHVSDIARAHVLALDHLARGGPRDTFNLGCGGGFSVRAVIEKARKVTGLPIETRVAQRRPGDAATLVASSARVREKLGWMPQKESLEVILGDAWAWLAAHPNGYDD